MGRHLQQRIQAKPVGPPARPRFPDKALRARTGKNRAAQGGRVAPGDYFRTFQIFDV
jgi:hypothetical protein